MIDGVVSASELLTDHFLRELHDRLYGAVWE